MLPTNRNFIDETLSINITGNASTADIANTPVISIKAEDDEVAFRMGGKGQNTYKKTINNVKHSISSTFDDSNRNLSELPDKEYLESNYYTKKEVEVLITQLEKEIITLSNKIEEQQKQIDDLESNDNQIEEVLSRWEDSSV